MSIGDENDDEEDEDEDEDDVDEDDYSNLKGLAAKSKIPYDVWFCASFLAFFCQQWASIVVMTDRYPGDY